MEKNQTPNKQRIPAALCTKWPAGLACFYFDTEKNGERTFKGLSDKTAGSIGHPEVEPGLYGLGRWSIKCRFSFQLLAHVATGQSTFLLHEEERHKTSLTHTITSFLTWSKVKLSKATFYTRECQSCTTGATSSSLESIRHSQIGGICSVFVQIFT